MDMQQITKLHPQTQAATSDLATVVDSNGVCKTKALIGASASMGKEQVGSVKPVPRDTKHCQVSMLGERIHSLALSF